jgi:hypothetical protein
VTDSSLGESSQDASAPDMLQASDRAASLIQRQFRRSSLTRGPPSSILAALSSNTVVAHSAFRVERDMQVVAETAFNENDKLFTIYEEEEEEEENAEEPNSTRSGKYLWGVTAAAIAFLGGGLLGGSPVDEDDAIAAVALIKGSAGGGGGGGGGAGGGGGGAGGGTAGAASAQ